MFVGRLYLMPRIQMLYWKSTINYNGETIDLQRCNQDQNLERMVCTGSSASFNFGTSGGLLGHLLCSQRKQSFKDYFELIFSVSTPGEISKIRETLSQSNWMFALDLALTQCSKVPENSGRVYGLYWSTAEIHPAIPQNPVQGLESLSLLCVTLQGKLTSLLISCSWLISVPKL